jgi:hypothetical protein
MFQRNKVVFFFSVGILLACFPLFAQTNPTLPQIDSLWRAFYGAPVHQCAVVYNKMAGGTTAEGDVSRDTLCIMRLISGERTATVKNLFPYAQCPSPFSGAGYDWGVMSGYAISRDGSRIAAQNCSGVIVCDSSGAHKKVVSTTSINSDCISLSFDDSTNNGITIHRIVFAAIPWLILRTTLSDTNTAVKTDTLWKQTDLDPCYTPTPWISGYTSVNKSGHYLSFNVVVNSGACIPVVADLNTKTYQLPLGDCNTDGCQIRSCRDTFGTVSFHIWSHRIPTTIWRWGTPSKQNAGMVPCPVDPINCDRNTGDPGQGGYYWCETDTNYMIQVGDNDVNASPGCYSKAYIRRGKTTDPPQVMYLGDYFGWPAMWIDSNAYSIDVINDRTLFIEKSSRVSVQINGSKLILMSTEGGGIYNARLINVKGVVVSRGEKMSADKQRFAISYLPIGIYLLSWQEATVVRSKVVTIAR